MPVVYRHAALNGTWTLFLVICQGIGLATAAGVRPFLPALLAGALAGADSGLDFDGTDFSFLERPHG